MSEQRNIVIVGGSAAGLMTAHNVMKYTLPALKAKADAKFHVYLINTSSNWFFRVASPRVATSTKRMAAEKVVFDINEGFKQYSPEDFTFIQVTATGLDTNARTVSYKSSKAMDSKHLLYHALVVATGSKTFYPAFSQSAGTEEIFEAIKATNEKVNSAKDIVIVGGGPTAIEFAAEFSNAERKVNITVLTATDLLLTALRPAIGKTAEQKIKALGVDVVYNACVIDAKEDRSGRTVVTLAKGKKLEADLYVPAYGVLPISSWLPSNLLDEKNYIKTSDTLRVDVAGPRVYAVGDIASYSRNNMWDIIQALPVLAVNIKRDLLSYNPMLSDDKPKGKDRVYVKDLRESMVVPFGASGGVGAVMGWRLLSWAVWLIKGRDYLLSMSGMSTVGGGAVKETRWTAEEAAI